jgi:Ca2+-dependent lipid-binding protein
VKAISAKNVFPQDPDGFSDPYVILELAGSKQKVQTNYIENDLNPVWNAELEPLDGSAVGSDVLKITLMDHDKPTKKGKKNDDDPIGLAEL